MDTARVRELLATEGGLRENAFEILGTIAKLSNRGSTQAVARELVIRTLAMQHELEPTFRHLLDHQVRAVGLLPYSRS